MFRRVGEWLSRPGGDAAQATTPRRVTGAWLVYLETRKEPGADVRLQSPRDYPAVCDAYGTCYHLYRSQIRLRRDLGLIVGGYIRHVCCRS